MTTTCETCRTLFEARPYKLRAGKARFCSRRCYRASVKRPDRRCAHCGTLISETGWHYEAKYCSQACYRSDQPNPAWKGGRIISADGYVLVWAPAHPMARSNGYVTEHRLVMAERLGRTLRPSEIVHHINGDKLDNRAENLELFASQSEHARHHDLGALIGNRRRV